MKNTRNSSLIVIVLIVAAIFFRDQINLDQLLGGQTSAPPIDQTSQSAQTTPDESTPVTSDDSLVMQNVKVYELDGNLAYEGDIDLAPVFERIERGELDPHDNDGSVFGNREGLLPQKERGYYREYVVRTPGMRSVGPQRLILGEGGEAYYTSDHYESFVQVRP